MRVKIKKLPTAQSGLEVKMKGLKSGLGLNSNMTPWGAVVGKMSQPSIKVNGTLQPVPRNQANLEAEKGEEAMLPTESGIPDKFTIAGKKHYDGGTPLNLPPDSFIFSDTNSMKVKDPELLKHFGMSAKKGGFTPASISKKFDINDYKKTLADPDTDDLQKKTAEAMISKYNIKLAKLGLIQESMKGFPQGIPKVAMPYIEIMNMDPAQFAASSPQPGDAQNTSDNQTAKYGAFLQIGGQPTWEDFKNQNKGFEEWKTYSGKNDPSSGYWNRVAGANLFKRKDSDVVDPRMDQALNKVMGTGVHGVGDYFGNLFSMPEKEINNLLTGYYEFPMETASRYGKYSGTQKFLGNTIPDPMMWPEIPYAGGKLLVKGITKAAPYVTAAAVEGYKVLSDLTIKYGPKIAQAVSHLIGKIPAEKVIQYAGRFNQAATHANNDEPTNDFNQYKIDPKILAEQDKKYPVVSKPKPFVDPASTAYSNLIQPIGIFPNPEPERMPYDNRPSESKVVTPKKEIVKPTYNWKP